MIALSRLINEDFPSQFTGSQKKEWELELLLAQREIAKKNLDKHKFDSGRWKAAKPQLTAETHGKCAYCEASFATVAYGDVEHYRPKSKYWWLAYAYVNYLASCQLCNQRYKKDKFPTANRRKSAPRVSKTTSDASLKRRAGKLAPDLIKKSKGKSFKTYLKNFKKERPLCINPYLDDPNEYFAYEFDDVLKEVTIVPLEDPDTSKFVKTAEEIYGLNRLELCRLRYQYLYHYRIHRLVAETSSEAILKILSQRGIDALKMSNSPFAGMIRYFDRQDEITELPLEIATIHVENGALVD